MDSISKKEVTAGVAILFILYTLCMFFAYTKGQHGTNDTTDKYRKLRQWQERASQICPGPVCHPLMGNIPEMIKAQGFSEELFVNLHAEHGDVVRFFLGPTMCNLSINNPDIIHELYKKARERPHETYMFLWYLGKENLLFARGKMVKDMRMRYTEMVAQRSQIDKLHLKSLQVFKAETDRWVSACSSPGSTLDVFDKLGPGIYDVMGSVLFDAPWLETEEGREIYRLHKKLIHDVNRWVLWPVGPIFHPAFIEYLLTIRKWRSMVSTLIERRAKDMRENPKKYENDRSAIHMILTSKADNGAPFFDRERAISTMCGFLNGAYDTTHCTSYWIIWQLAKNPEVQTKLYDEFSRVLGNAEPTVDDLRKCDYLHAFIQESMRCRATVPVNQRVSDEEDVKIGDYIVPKGTNVNIPNCVIFKDERWFGKNPEQFRPERFLGDSPEAERARKSWIAFGEHMRMCVGMVFALVEMKVMTYAIVTRSIVELENPNDPGEVMIEAGVNQPANHQKFIFRPRDMGKMREEENLKWWMAQIDALEKIKPVAGSVAQVA